MFRSFGVLLALLALTLPATAAEPGKPAPAIHEESSRAMAELGQHLESLHSRWRDHFRGSEAPSERPLISLALRYRDQLGLSAQQIQSLEQLRNGFQPEATRRQGEIQAAQKELENLLASDPVDLGRVEAKIREIERLNADYRIARIRTIEQGKAQLSPDQRSKLQSLLTEPRRPAPRT